MTSAASLFGAKFTCVWARESGIETAQTRLKDVRGSTALLTSRIDRAAGKPLFTLSARTLTAGRMGSYLGIADILNSDGASPAEDLPKVWRRMAFALLTGAADAPERWLFVREEFGWRLAPAHGWRPNTGAARPMTADGGGRLPQPKIWFGWRPTLL